MSKRNKYNYAFRLRCVEAVTKKRRSILEVAQENGLSRANLQLWLGFYGRYGKDGLHFGEIRRHYDFAFKKNVLMVMDSENLSLYETSIRFRIPSPPTIIKWRRAYGSHGDTGLSPQPKGRPKSMNPPIKRKPKKSSKPLTREEELLEENERLRAENELLKKLHALVQADKKQKP